MLMLKTKISIWKWCDFCMQKSQLQVPTKTAAKSKLPVSAWTLRTKTNETGLHVYQVLRYLLQIKATAMRSSLNWHFIPDQFWKRDKENKVMLHGDPGRFYIQICTGRASFRLDKSTTTHTYVFQSTYIKPSVFTAASSHYHLTQIPLGAKLPLFLWLFCSDIASKGQMHIPVPPHRNSNHGKNSILSKTIVVQW